MMNWRHVKQVRWSRACWVGWLTLLPMTRRRDAVGTANWLARGGARGRTRGGTAPGLAVVPRPISRCPLPWWVRCRPVIDGDHLGPSMSLIVVIIGACSCISADFHLNIDRYALCVSGNVCNSVLHIIASK